MLKCPEALHYIIHHAKPVAKALSACTCIALWQIGQHELGRLHSHLCSQLCCKHKPAARKMSMAQSGLVRSKHVGAMSMRQGANVQLTGSWHPFITGCAA